MPDAKDDKQPKPRSSVPANIKPSAGAASAPRMARSMSSGTSRSPSNSPSAPSNAPTNKPKPKTKKPAETGETLSPSANVNVSVIDPMPEFSSDHRPKDECPCGVSKPKTWMIDCSKCLQHWHLECVSLNGLGKGEINKLIDYLCPLCYVPPIKIDSPNNPDVCQMCKNTVALSRANNNYELNLTESHQAKLDAIILSSTNAAAENTRLMQKLQDELDSLSKKIQDTNSSILQSTATAAHPPPPDILDSPTCDIPDNPCSSPTNSYTTDFLAETDADLILEFLEKERLDGKFSKANGREMLAFGPTYKWSNYQNKGSSSNTQNPDIPSELSPLMSKINSIHGPKPFNNVLINYYPEKSDATKPSSHIPMHSDDEYEIDPGSLICSYSLGATRRISFSERHGSGSDFLDVESNSLYTMTRESQTWYKHGIQDAICGARYSVTVRQITPDNKRGILLIGDSNTSAVRFGSGRGTVGERFPGKRVKASKIEDIEPSLCGEYRNIFLVCGTNDLRPKENPQIDELVSKMIGKIKLIKLLNPRCKLFAMPVLPTRDRDMNKNIVMYNRKLCDWIKSMTQIDPSITMPPVYSFLDSYNLLATPLTRDGDKIHLGELGISKFVTLMKELVYNNLDSQNSNGKRQQHLPINRSGSLKPA